MVVVVVEEEEVVVEEEEVEMQFAHNILRLATTPNSVSVQVAVCCVCASLRCICVQNTTCFVSEEEEERGGGGGGGGGGGRFIQS